MPVENTMEDRKDKMDMQGKEMGVMDIDILDSLDKPVRT